MKLTLPLFLREAWILLIIFLSMLPQIILGQKNLTLDYSAIDLVSGIKNNPSDIYLCDSISKSTSLQLVELICHKNESDKPSLKDALSKLSNKINSQPDYFLCNNLDSLECELISLINDSKQINPDSLSISVKKYFPLTDVSQLRTTIFFTVCGWQWGDAVAFNYSIYDNKCILEGDLNGIMINLQIFLQYADNNSKRIQIMKDILKHEIFHIYFAQHAKVNGFSKHQNEFDQLTYIMQNEGIAHFLSLINSTSDAFFEKHIKSTIQQIDSLLVFLKDPDISHLEKTERINRGTYGPFWSKFICIAGLYTASKIYENDGISGLQKSIDAGPEDFFKKYCQYSNQYMQNQTNN